MPLKIKEYANDLTPPDARRLHPSQVYELCAQYDNPDVLEFGGGRWPMFPLESFPRNLGSYTVNDIDQCELDHAPEGYRTACFDVCGDVSDYEGKFDVIISKMFAEHVTDGRKMHENALRMLKDGGVAFHFMPKLYASPFVVNRLVPERLTRWMLIKIQPHRATEHPKFPAIYSWCRGTTKSMQRKIKSVGYSEVIVVPFFGHHYFDKLPGLKQLERMTRRICIKYQITFFSTVVFVFAKK